jgi:cbb3-type cytochrome oxidase subunit 3
MFIWTISDAITVAFVLASIGYIGFLYFKRRQGSGSGK